MSIDFCHIAPIPHLDVVRGRKTHLVLAHLVDSSQYYVDFYRNESRHGATIILDNSAFELFERGQPMYPSEKLIELGKTINADYIVLSDYPGEDSKKTIDAAISLAPQFINAGFKTFFVPQSKCDDFANYVMSLYWAADNSHLIDYIGLSIIGVPHAYGIKHDNRLQRFTSRLKLFHDLEATSIFKDIVSSQNQKIHMLGLTDGPNEILYLKHFHQYITSWDSSSAVWAGLHNIEYDDSPTGMVNGKVTLPVDFNFETTDKSAVAKAQRNIEYIDCLCEIN